MENYFCLPDQIKNYRYGTEEIRVDEDRLSRLTNNLNFPNLSSQI